MYSMPNGTQEQAEEEEASGGESQEEIGEAARCADVGDALQCVVASAIGRAGLAMLAGEEEGSRPEQVSGRRCAWPHGGHQMSGGRCDICQRVAYHCGSQ